MTYKVFISSTYLDNVDRRKIVQSAVNRAKMVWIGMEHFSASTEKSVDECLRYVDEADLFVGIIAHRYGWIPEGKDIAITEMEYESAKKRLMFVIDSKLPISPGKDYDSGKDKWKKQERLEIFKNRISSDQMPAVFNENNLEVCVYQALEDWKKKQKENNKKDISPANIHTIIPKQYKKWVLDKTKNMDIDLLRGDDKVVNISLPELYQPLYSENPEKQKNDKNIHEKESTVNIEELAAKGEYLVVQGSAGSGKTTLMKHLLRSIINNDTKLFESNILPIIFFMKDFKDYPYKKACRAKGVLNILQWHIQEVVDNGLSIEIIQKFCEKGKAVFLIDGLDEVETGTREFIVNAFADFRLKHDKIKIILAGRPHGVEGASKKRFGDRIARVNDFTNKQVTSFINTWFDAVYHKESETGQNTAKKMIGEIKANEDIDALKRNPLMLTAMCILYNDLKELPHQRAELYERFIKRLLSKFGKDKTKVYSFMMELAHTMFIDKSRGIDERGAVKIIKKHFKDTDELPGDRFERIESGSGLMHFENGQYRFSHLTFQEFLTACYLYDTSEESPFDIISPFIDDKRYREVVELFIGFLSIRGSGSANGIVRKVLNDDSDNHFYRWRVVSKALLDIHKDNRKDAVCDLAKDRMLTVLRTGEKTNVLTETGENLGRLGYERGYTDFVKIKEGDYDLEGIGIKEVPSFFEISKYPVTNLWFKKFIADKGYKTSSYWSKEGIQFLKDNNISEPGYWNERDWNCPNSPVVGISWYEAEAFSRWLTENKEDGYEYRLPSEFEWQAVAAGEKKRKYPWGSEIDPSKCNYDESEIGRISPVGIFKKGATPERVHDLAGNVWEWTSSFYDKDKDSYVLRGGSFYYFSVYCRCAYRFSYHPFDRVNVIGFRCSRVKL